METKEMTGLRVKALESVIPALDPKDRGFAQSLVDQWNKHNRLSDKQIPWVTKLVARAERKDLPAETTDVGTFKGVLDLFKTASQHLKYPKITVVVHDQEVQLSVAGPNAKAPGTVNVTDGKPFGQNQWFGRVHPDGKWERGHKVDDEQAEEIKTLLQEFSEHPAETAGKYGKLTGRCCFCNSGLTDEHSTGVGFGPVCAKNYGLTAQWKAASNLLKEAA